MPTATHPLPTPSLRALTSDEAEEAGHDAGEIHGVPIMRLELPGARLDFEQSQSAIWILNVTTEEPMRGQGRATALLRHLEGIRGGRRVEPGVFTEDGRRYLSRLVDALGWQN